MTILTITTLAALKTAARDAGVEITIATAGARPYRLIQRGRGTRAFTNPRNLHSELLYLASLRASDAEHRQPEIEPTVSSVDTYAGKVAHAKASSTCFACRHYSAPLQTLSGFCKLGAPDWSHSRDINTVRWDNTCARFEEN